MVSVVRFRRQEDGAIGADARSTLCAAATREHLAPPE
jgi:hypothetical protein